MYGTKKRIFNLHFLVAGVVPKPTRIFKNPEFPTGTKVVLDIISPPKQWHQLKQPSKVLATAMLACMDLP
jgi:hypothetical protein